MSHDLQMARGAGDGEINLAIGEPYFLRRIVTNHLKINSLPKEPLYPAIGGEPELLAELKHLYDNYEYVVVTNGAKQAIEAAFFAFKTVDHKTTVAHPTPYWPSYPTLAKSQGLGFHSAAPRAATIACVTAPNNPDGSQSFDGRYDLWDAAYAQPLYGYHGFAPPHRVAVNSAAKLLGLSGLRVGWLCTNEWDLAERAAYFVEIATSGVAVPSQMYVAACLNALRNPAQMAEITARSFEARAALMTNGNTFNELLSDLTQRVRGVPADGTGMFAWFQARRPEALTRAFRDARVKVVTGDVCGEREPGWFRMSMGHMPEVTREVLQRVRHEYFAGWVSK